MSKPVKLNTLPQIEQAFHEHYRGCFECQTAMQAPTLRQLCVTGQMLSTLLVTKLKGGGKKK